MCLKDPTRAIFFKIIGLIVVKYDECGWFSESWRNLVESWGKSCGNLGEILWREGVVVAVHIAASTLLPWPDYSLRHFTFVSWSGTQDVTNIFQILRLHKSHLLNWLFALKGTNLFTEAGDGGVDQEEGHLAWENNSGIICIHPFLLPVHLFCRFAWDTEERLWRTAWEVRVVPGDIVKDGFCDESNLWPPFCWICNPQRSKIRMKSNINMRNLLHAGVSPSCLLFDVWIPPRTEEALTPPHSTAALRQVPSSIRFHMHQIFGNAT